MYLTAYDIIKNRRQMNSTIESNPIRSAIYKLRASFISRWLSYNQFHDNLWKINFLTLYEDGLKGFRPDQEKKMKQNHEMYDPSHVFICSLT